MENFKIVTCNLIINVDFERSKRGQKLEMRTKLARNSVINWSWVKYGHKLDIYWAKYGFGQKLVKIWGTPSCGPKVGLMWASGGPQAGSRQATG